MQKNSHSNMPENRKAPGPRPSFKNRHPGKKRLTKKPRYVGLANLGFSLVFIFVGCGLFAGKQIHSSKIRQDLASAQPASLSFGNPFEEFRNKGELGTVPTSEEALKWVYLLQSIEDEELSDGERLKKYENLSMATAILSASCEGHIRQRFWSGQAVEYGEAALSILSESEDLHPADEFDEANTRLLMAMALNYFQNGGISAEEVADQFENIDRDYLRDNGFSQNKLLRALAEKGIVELPGLFAEINI